MSSATQSGIETSMYKDLDNSNCSQQQNLSSLIRNNNSYPTRREPGVRSFSQGKRMTEKEMNASVERLYRGISPVKRRRENKLNSQLPLETESNPDQVKYPLNDGNNTDASRSLTPEQKDKLYNRLFSGRREKSMSIIGARTRAMSEGEKEDDENQSMKDQRKPFVPMINKHSVELVKSGTERMREELGDMGDSGNFGTYLYNKEKKFQKIKQDKIDKALQQREEDETKELRSVPLITKYNSTNILESDRDVLTWFDEYEKKKQNQLKAKVAEEQNKLVSECSFSPTISRGPIKRSRSNQASASPKQEDNDTNSNSKSVFDSLYSEAESLKKRREELYNTKKTENTFSPSITEYPGLQKMSVMERVEKLLTDWGERQRSLELKNCDVSDSKIVIASDDVDNNNDNNNNNNNNNSGAPSSFLRPYNSPSRSRLRGANSSVYDDLYEDAIEIDVKKTRMTLQEALKDKILSNITHINERSNKLVTESRKSVITDIFCVIARDGILKIDNEGALNLDDIPDKECRDDIMQALKGIRGKIDVFGFCYLMETYLEACPIPRQWLKRL